MKKHVKNEAAEQILQHVKTNGPTSRADICTVIGMTSKDASYPFDILTNHGHLVRDNNTGKYHLPVNVTMRHWLSVPWRKSA